MSDDSGERIYLGVPRPGVIRYRVKLIKMDEGDTEWTPEALASMAGQRGKMDEGEHFTIIKAWIEDGWIAAEIEAETPDYKPQPRP